MLLHLLLRLDREVENDVSRYMKRSSIVLQKKELLPKRVTPMELNHQNNINQVDVVATISSSDQSGTLRTVTATTAMELAAKYGWKELNDIGRTTAQKVSIMSPGIKMMTTLEKVTHDDSSFLSSPGLYWNLSCPLELSMFSGAHMGGDYLERAWKARELARNETLTLHKNLEWRALKNRRIYFIGDSLLRQVFISLACISWDHVESYAVPWYDKRPVRSRQPHTIGSGAHSKFEEARVRLKGNVELIFHHGIGNLVELGQEYHSQDPNSWLKQCYMKRPFTTVSPTLPDRRKGQHEMNTMTTVNVTRQNLTVTSNDIVVLNGSVHRSRDFNLRNIVDFLQCKALVKYPDHNWPTFVYLITGASHFPTDTGAFKEELLETEDDFGCINVTEFRGHQIQELSLLQDHVPIIGAEVADLQYKSGDLHVGGRDCLHWLQPGIPDLLAAKVSQFVTAAVKS